MKLKSHAIDKVGEWTPKGGLNVTDKYAFQHGKKCTKVINDSIYMVYKKYKNIQIMTLRVSCVLF